MYHKDDPLHGSVVPGSLPSPQEAYKGYQPLLLTSRISDDLPPLSPPTSSLVSTSNNNNKNVDKSNRNNRDNKMHILEILNENVKLPTMDTLYWCKVFEFRGFGQKHHLIKVSELYIL